VKLLLDACVWGGAEIDLVEAGHDVLHAGAWAEDPGDEAILATAHADGRVLVTLDKDFGELAIVHGQAHSGIVRLVGVAARRQAGVIDVIVRQYGPLLSAGALVTVEPNRVRVRRAEGETDR
jgi:predicted nuclease of predicted toxin-antitoxin system